MKPYDELLRAVNDEDKAVITGIRRGVNFSGAPQGRLSYLERNVWEFGRYYSRRIAGGPE